MNPKVYELFQQVHYAATEAHRFHLVPKNYAEHKILGEFYPAIIDVLDEFIECYFGSIDPREVELPAIKRPTPACNTGKEVVTHLQSWITKYRDSLPQASELQNILDELLALCDRALGQLERYT